MPTMVPDLVLVIYLHGFKGDESTFLKFPERMNHIVAETLPDCVVESVVFPAYEVRLLLKTVPLSGTLC